MDPVFGTYDYRYVALSVLVAIATFYTAMTFTENIVLDRKGKQLWLFGGACAIGSGIWCMHCTSILAYRLPIPVYCHLPSMAFSLLVAVLTSWGMLSLVCRRRKRLRHILAGSVLMGAGIVGMHFSAMAALRLQASYSYRPELLILWLCVAITSIYLCLKYMFFYRKKQYHWAVKMGFVVALGMTASVVYYAGMSAVRFVSTPALPDLSNSIGMTMLTISAVVLATILGLGFVVAATLVSRKLSAEKTKLGEERSVLRALIDNMPDYIYVKDLESRFVFANPYVAHDMGAEKPEALYGKTDHDFYAPEIADSFLREEQNLLRTGEPLKNIEERAVDRAGNEIYILTTKVPLRNDKGEMFGFAGIGRNVTAFKKMEKALREAEVKYRGLFDQANFGIFQSTPDGALLHVNQAMVSTFGYESIEEMVTSITDIGCQLFADDKRGIEFMLTMDRVGGVRNFECEMNCKDGNRIWTNMSICAVREKNAIVRYEGMCDDITERVQLREQLLQAQKLEAVGQLAAGIAHEINTPIQYIGDNVQFLQEVFVELNGLIKQYEQLFLDAEDVPSCAKRVGEIREAQESIDTEYLLEEIPKAIFQTKEGVMRVATLVNAMKEFSHPGRNEKTPLDLNRAIENTITVARNEWKFVADVETDFDPALPPVHCHPGEFNQVMLNLIVNAAQAIANVVKRTPGEKGKITVRTKCCAGRAEISVEDTGTGIPESIRSRIFDPFFTTKEIGKGTGQGLSIARSIIVNRHGGNIFFETSEGKGTCFIVSLPLENITSTPKGVAA
ncbi:PAS domain S-box protein [Telmatobacter bradus]|uniref:PAS domain S-box protein n=1 Tax=Telmatobacter bradus TaxID=474953 RepID=UPI003B43C24E